MPARLALGLDFGTGGCRALLVDVETGEAAGSAEAAYASGVVEAPGEPLVARQVPADYRSAASEAVGGALAGAVGEVVGLGVDTTASTPLPVGPDCGPLADDPRFASDPAALAWLWKDHSSHAEAAEITERAAELPYLGRCGGSYSSEWYWAKLLRAARTAGGVAREAAAWLELQDWVPAWLCGAVSPGAAVRGVCAAGHKGLWSPEWGGYPDAGFLGSLHPELGRWREALAGPCLPAGSRAGTLAAGPAAALGLRPGLPVSVGAVDAHLGAVGAGIRPGRLVKIVGTSSCDIALGPLGSPLIEGVAGVVPGSVLPGYDGIEAGQAAVGDLFDWCSRLVGLGLEELTEKAFRLRPGESGLLALDWNNGNRNVLADPLLSGLVLGQTLSTGPGEVFRAMVEATAFGARAILERIEGAGTAVEELVLCGGGAARSPLVLQVYADVLGRPIVASEDPYASARGAAMCGAVAAGAHPGFEEALAAMAGPAGAAWHPDPGSAAVYGRLYALWRRVHDAFGTGATAGLGGLMRELHGIREEARRA